MYFIIERLPFPLFKWATQFKPLKNVVRFNSNWLSILLLLHLYRWRRAEQQIPYDAGAYHLFHIPRISKNILMKAIIIIKSLKQLDVTIIITILWRFYYGIMEDTFDNLCLLSFIPNKGSWRLPCWHLEQMNFMTYLIMIIGRMRLETFDCHQYIFWHPTSLWKKSKW